jgi:hypothetical protein
MANVYYCQSIHRNLGILRAVFSPEECRLFLSGHIAQFVGPHFPATTQGHSDDCALIRLFENDSDGSQPVGYYRFDAAIPEIELALQAVTAKPHHASAEKNAHLTSKSSHATNR